MTDLTKARSDVKGHWFLPRGGRETCPVTVTRTARWWPWDLPSCWPPPTWVLSSTGSPLDRPGLGTGARSRRWSGRRGRGAGAGPRSRWPGSWASARRTLPGADCELIAMERFSYAASTRRYRPSAASWATGSSPMSSTTTRSARRTRAMALVTVSSARCRRSRTPRSSRVNQATLRPCSTACWPEGLEQERLAGPRRPAHDQVLPPADPLQGAQRLLGRGRDRGRLRAPGVEGLAGREPGGGAAGGQRGPFPPGGLVG